MLGHRESGLKARAGSPKLFIASTPANRKPERPSAMRLFPDLRERHRRPERMDQPGLDPAEHRRALVALRRINGVSGGVGPVWPWIRGVLAERREANDPRPVRLLDLASGGGDFAIRLARRARREGWDLQIAGRDRSAFAVDYANEQARRAGLAVDFHQGDVLNEPLPPGFDILTCSLFLHHLDEPEAVALLSAMRAAGELAIIDDLERTRLGWALAFAGVRALSRSPVARYDGAVSVQGAHTRDEARALALKAGWERPEIQPRWPCRYLLVERRP